MKQKRKSDVAVLLDYAGSHKGLTFLGLALSAVSMLLSMAPYICIWLAARDLIAVAPDWTEAQSVAQYGWLAFAFAVAGIILYFAGLMCTHLAAFRTASNIRKQGVAHVMKAPLGFFDSNASGLIRGRLDAAAADTETLLAHNLADIVGTITLFVAMLVMMLVFDWRMGAACLLAAVISIVAMFSMMGGKNAQILGEYQAALDRITKAGTEYVRGIPVVKIFQQTVYSFKAFQEAIEDYSTKAEHYQADICRTPQSVNLTFTEGACSWFRRPCSWRPGPWPAATSRGLSQISPFTRCSPPSSPRPLPRSCSPHRASCWPAPPWAASTRSWALPS